MALRKFEFCRIVLCCTLILLIAGSDTIAYGANYSRALSHFIMAGVFETWEELDEAIPEYKQALKLDPHSAILHFRLACVYIKKKDFDNAIKELKLTVDYDPELLESYFLLTLIYSLQNKYDLATGEYEKFLTHATKLDPHNIELYKRLGEIYFEQNNLESAEKVYRTIVDLSPQDMRARLLLGVIYERLDRIEEAIKEFETVISVDADNHIALNALGYLFAEKGINLDRAEVMIKKALEFQPDNGAYLDSLGWVYFRKGLIEEALKKLKRASGLSEDPVIFNHLGEVYFSGGDLDNAEESWRRSLEIDDSQGSIKQKINNLKRLKSRR